MQLLEVMVNLDIFVMKRIMITNNLEVFQGWKTFLPFLNR